MTPQGDKTRKDRLICTFCQKEASLSLDLNGLILCEICKKDFEKENKSTTPPPSYLTDRVKFFGKEKGELGRSGAYPNTMVSDLDIDHRGQYLRDLFCKYEDEVKVLIQQSIEMGREIELEIRNRKRGEKNMGEEIVYSINDTTRAIIKQEKDLKAFESPLCDGRIKAMILTKLQEARLLSLELIKKE